MNYGKKIFDRRVGLNLKYEKVTGSQTKQNGPVTGRGGLS